VADWVDGNHGRPADYSIAAQVWIQAKAVVYHCVWSGGVSAIAYFIVDLTIGLRVSEEQMNAKVWTSRRTARRHTEKPVADP
jgi:Amt family ammonium transporter